MIRPSKIHAGKDRTFRRHFLAEWLEERGMEPMDLIDSLNEAASLDQGEIDKSQVYRWLRGQLPRRETQLRIAAALNLKDSDDGEPNPEMLMVHPAQDWIASKLRGRSREDLQKVRSLIELVLPDRSGTDG